jgi:hypothetical protein
LSLGKNDRHLIRDNALHHSEMKQLGIGLNAVISHQLLFVEGNRARVDLQGAGNFVHRMPLGPKRQNLAARQADEFIIWGRAVTATHLSIGPVAWTETRTSILIASDK